MKAERWQLLSRLFAALAVVALVGAWTGYAECVYSVAGGMGRELNPLTERDLGQVIKLALNGVETVPESFVDRAGLAHPICYKDHSIGDNGIFYALFVLMMILMVFARNQAHLIRNPKIEGRTHGMETRRSEPVPDEIDIGDVSVGLSAKDRALLEAVGDVNVRDESLMLYLKRKTDDDAEETKGPQDIDGFFCPPGYHDKPIVYVDPGHAAASDELAGEDPVGNQDRPFSTLNGAIEMARKLLEEGAEGVMLRIMPGVYHASIDVPDKVVLCNHRLPAEGTPRSRLNWLTDQSVDDPDNVTILAPDNAQYAVQFEPGVRQGICGCHIVGRESVKQAGIVAVNSRSLALVNCSVEGFIGGGIRLQDSGTELAGGAVLVFGCRLHRNEARIGGALYAERSSVSIADCIIEHNKALTGGAIYCVDARAPLFITNSRIAHNRAQLDHTPELSVESASLRSWKQFDGLGGGAYLRNSKLKAAGAEFVENGASVAGGGLALLNSKAVLETDENRVRFPRNRSRLGAGFAVIGWEDGRATLKCTGALIERNTATIAGGGMLALGIATVQIFDSQFRKNEIGTKDGVGAAAAAWMGAELLASGVEVNENKSAGFGGGLGIVNARLSIKGDSVIRANTAGRSGAGIYAITTTSEVVRDLVRKKILKVPFSVTLEATKIADNMSTEIGCALRGGNELGVPTIPIGFKIAEDVKFRLNRTKSQQENGDDFWVTWAGAVKGTDRDRPVKLVLR